MEPALKQRLVGAAVLVALAVIFLPMLIKGPAPESGVGDIRMDVPPAPDGEFETRELPLLPSRTPAPGVEGGEGVDAGSLPTVDTLAEREADAVADAGADDGSEMFPAPTAGGGYAVTFGSYGNQADARRVVDALLASQLAGYQEPEQRDGRTLHRVLIGPFDSRATAEAARLRAAHVRDDVGSRVLVLDANPDAAELADAPARPEARPEPEPTAATPSQPAPEPRRDPEPEPVAAPEPAAVPEPAPAAASGVGFAVQLGSFSSEASAIALRDRARSQGLSAFTEAVQTDKGRVHRVQVGPVADRAAADQLKAQVKARLQIDGLVHSHP